MISNAIPQGAVARVIGTKLEFIDNRELFEKMPIQVTIMAPPSAAAEGTVTADEAFDFITAKAVGDEMGYMSPAYRVARILRPDTGGGVSTIRTAVFPIIPTAGALATDPLSINMAGGNPTKNTQHVLIVNGRRLPFSVLAADDLDALATRIKATLDAAIQVNPVTSVVEVPVANDIDITMTAGWNGASGNGINIEVEADDPAGVIYTNPVFAGGVGTFDLTTALANFGETWFNIVINACDDDEAVLDQLENFNGTPELGTGRWNPITMLPLVSFYGSVDSDKDTITAVPDTRKLDLTNSKVPAPGSPAFDFEVAASYVTDIAITVAQNPPQAYSGHILRDIPAPATPELVGDFKDFEGRDFIEKKGVSTATLRGGIYYIEDVNTHYHPDGLPPEASPYFRVVNVLGRSFNIIYQYRLEEQITLMDKILFDDAEQTTNPEAIDPKQWAGVVRALIDSWQTEGLTTRADESRETVKTGIGSGNPDRVLTSFNVIYSGNVRQAGSTIGFGFNFG
jgi:phage tail sheath gpL-like